MNHLLALSAADFFHQENKKEDPPDMHQGVNKKRRKRGSALKMAGFGPVILSRFMALILARK